MKSIWLIVFFTWVLCVGGCGGGEGSGGGASAKLYLLTDSDTSLNYLSMEPGDENSCATSFLYTDDDAPREFTAILNGDITGTTIKLHLWAYAVDGSELEASLILSREEQEIILATWEGLATTSEDEYEEVTGSTTIAEQATQAGDEIILRLSCSGDGFRCEIRYECLDSYIEIPDVGEASVSVPSTEETQDEDEENNGE